MPTAGCDQMMERVTVDIFGERYTIRGEAESNHIVDVAHLVDSRMRELKKSHPQLTRQRIAILAAVNLADELLQVKEGAAGAGGGNPELERRTRQLISLLDEGLIGDRVGFV